MKKKKYLIKNVFVPFLLMFRWKREIRKQIHTTMTLYVHSIELEFVVYHNFSG